MQSHGQKCRHNHVDGVAATRLVLGCIRQRLLTPTALAKLGRRLRELAEEDMSEQNDRDRLAGLRQRLAATDDKTQIVQRNLARAKTDVEYDAVSAEFRRLAEEREKLSREIAAEETNEAVGKNVDAEIATALEVLHCLPDLATDIDSAEQVQKVVGMTNARLFLAFQAVRPKNRVVNRVQSGVVTFGSAPPPIEIYAGPTSRAALRVQPAEPGSKVPITKNRVVSGEEGESSGNGNRGNKTPLELFLTGVAGWSRALAFAAEPLMANSAA